ncbi:MAG TPA: HEPN domain-containing protein [Gaiellaceae bacterium]
MSPRSKEFMDQARERLLGARDALASGHLADAASAAYYAMLYAARAALSERDLYAKTHSGVWTSFEQEFATGGAFDPELVAEARRAQQIRELGDYEARPASEEQARLVVDNAERFVTAVAGMLGE